MKMEYLRILENAPGSLYTTDACIDCGLCSGDFPRIFRRLAEEGVAVVHRQPETEADWREAAEAIDCCPVDAIQRETPL